MGCRIDIGNRRIELTNKADEEEYAVPIMNIELLNSEEKEKILRCIDEKIENIDCKDEGILECLKEILIRNRNVFRECPGRIEGYSHEFQVTDRTPYFQRGCGLCRLPTRTRWMRRSTGCCDTG